MLRRRQASRGRSRRAGGRAPLVPLTTSALHEADLRLFRRIAAIRPGPADRLSQALSVLANRGVLWMAVAAVLAADGRAGRRAALRGLLSLALASAVVNVPAKLAARRARPDLRIVPAARRLARVPTSGSLPSGHAASAAAFTTGVALEAPVAAVPVGLLGAAVAYSRVHTGVHYPGDVLVGVGMGVSAALAVRHWWPTIGPHPAAAGTRTLGPDVPLPEGEGLVVVINPAAGSNGDRVAEDIRALLPRAACRTPSSGEPLEQVLRAAADEARVLGIAGGDGSVNAAAGVAHAAGVPLAVFPAGTLNNFAADLGLETLADAATAVVAGRTALVDVAEIDGRPFLNSATLGAYPELVAARERLEERIGKWPALAVGAWRVLRSASPVAVTLDGEERRLWLAFLGNCRFEPSGFAPQRRAQLDDGILDVRLVDGAGPLARARLLFALATGRLARSAVYREFTAKAVEVRTEQPLRLSRDGEIFQGATVFRVTKRDNPLPVVVPPPGGPPLTLLQAFTAHRR